MDSLVFSFLSLIVNLNTQEMKGWLLELFMNSFVPPLIQRIHNNKLSGGTLEVIEWLVPPNSFLSYTFP